MNEVRFIQKIGQVPMAELVENAAKLGFVLAGSPTLVSNVPAQLMIQADKPASNPEYILVEKTGQLKLSTQVEQLLDQGWEIYGSMLAGEVPMQAMVRGDIGVHTMFGIGGGEGPGPAPADWQKEIARVDENLTEIYAVLNSLPNMQPEIDKAQAEAVKEAKGYTDQRAQQQEAYMDNSLRSMNENMSSQYLTLLDQNQALTLRINDLEIALNMEAEERRQDIQRLEGMMTVLLSDIAEVKAAVPSVSAWKQ